MSAELVQALHLRSRQLRESATSLRGTYNRASEIPGDICSTCHRPVSQWIMGSGAAAWKHLTEPAIKHEAVPLDYSDLLRRAEMHAWLADEYLTLANLIQGLDPNAAVIIKP